MLPPFFFNEFCCAAIEDLESKALEAIQKEDLILAKQFQSHISRLKAAMPVPEEECTPRPAPDDHTQRSPIARKPSRADIAVFLVRMVTGSFAFVGR